jgi:hypothetical protein
MVVTWGRGVVCLGQHKMASGTLCDQQTQTGTGTVMGGMQHTPLNTHTQTNEQGEASEASSR